MLPCCWVLWSCVLVQAAAHVTSIRCDDPLQALQWISPLSLQKKPSNWQPMTSSDRSSRRTGSSSLVPKLYKITYTYSSTHADWPNCQFKYVFESNLISMFIPTIYASKVVSIQYIGSTISVYFVPPQKASSMGGDVGRVWGWDLSGCRHHAHGNA